MKACIVGCGGIAKVHARALHEFADVRLTGCADIIPERARELAEEYGANAYTDLSGMLEKERPDVLHICTPHYLHAPMTDEAARAGINVFCEKPPVISHEQWGLFENAAKLVSVGICFQNRYNNEALFLKELVHSGRLGKILGARAFVTWSRDGKYYTESGWRGTFEREGGGSLINQAIHTLDLLLLLLGRPKTIQASNANRHLEGVIEVEDTIEAHLDFGGSTAIFFSSNAYSTDSPVLLEISCEEAVVRMEDGRVTCRMKDGGVQTAEFPPQEFAGKSYWGSGHAICIRDYYDCLKEKRQFPISTESVINTKDTVLGIYESAKIHKKVRLT